MNHSGILKNPMWLKLIQSPPLRRTSQPTCSMGVWNPRTSHCHTHAFFVIVALMFSNVWLCYVKGTEHPDSAIFSGFFQPPAKAPNRLAAWCLWFVSAVTPREAGTSFRNGRLSSGRWWNKLQKLVAALVTCVEFLLALSCTSLLVSNNGSLPVRYYELYCSSCELREKNNWYQNWDHGDQLWCYLHNLQSALFSLLKKWLVNESCQVLQITTSLTPFSEELLDNIHQSAFAF